MALQSNRYLSTWLQWSLARPNSAFRDETIIVDELNKKGEVVRHVPLMELPAINPNGHKWLPKEGWLANFCRTEKLQGRKVLVYVRQTGKRDIQDHLVLPLEENGLRVTVLGGNVDPRKREEWIAKRADRLDVLVCNPELVKTGLDLVQFSSVVFFEITYSLYTLWQAVRRVWRLGQVRPVRAIFSVYNGTMEARALSLMGAKMKAAQLLYGDEVGGAIVPRRGWRPADRAGARGAQRCRLARLANPVRRRDEGEQQPTGQHDHAKCGDLAGREGDDLVGLDGGESGRGSEKIEKGGGTGRADGIGDFK